MRYRIINPNPLTLSHTVITPDEILEAVNRTNSKFHYISEATQKMNLDIFSVIDFRNFSGMVGEAFAEELSQVTGRLIKNPNMDGYPDLLQNSTIEMQEYYSNCNYSHLLDYRYSGIEIKNTFGTKKTGAPIQMGDERIGYINNKLDWKAHHQKTNNLLALFSDYENNKPVIMAAFYSDSLEASDWQKVQKPIEGSTMTSFSTILQSGCDKLCEGMIICADNKKYLDFFNCEAKL